MEDSGEDADESDTDSTGLERDVFETSDFLHTEQRRFTFEEVLGQEMERIEKQRRRRDPSAQGRERFSLAFSGGGVRAAAFQAGVLWRLAAEDRLQDVEYLTAVSGGGYIASAFFTHLMAEGIPEHGEVKEWYLRVVAKTLKRMQINCGDFVRDCVAIPGYSDAVGSGYLPRVFDLPILLVVVAVTLMVNPIFFVLNFLVPLMVIMDFFLGASMRATFCVQQGADWFTVFDEFSCFSDICLWLKNLMIGAIVVAALRFLPWCKLRAREGPGRAEAPLGFLFGHASAALLKRLVFMILVFIVFILIVPMEERLQYSRSEATDLCSAYIHKFHHNVSNVQPKCSDYHDGKMWYSHWFFDNYTQHRTDWFGTNSSGKFVTREDTETPKRLQFFNLVQVLSLGIAAVLTVSLCVIPVIGPKVFGSLIAFSGPFMLFGCSLTIVQYAVFGPVTNNQHGFFGGFNEKNYEKFVVIALGLATVLVPFYEDIRSLMHLYYQRCLRQNFFADGRDVNIRDLTKNPYCPFLLLTGTSNDFQPPGDTDTISELSFSPLHTGGEETGYYHTPTYRGLSKCAAISGAGCLDAITLSMSNAISMRFWLEVLNLSWGDYMILDHYGWFSGFIDCMGKIWGGPLIRIMHRIPSALLWVAAFVTFQLAWQKALAREEVDCDGSAYLFQWGWRLLFSMFVLSFFSFLPLCDTLACSAVLRQMQQVTRYCFVGNKPPRMLYMTDGGVKDCTAIVQLLWRRRERILLVLAAADPKDELAVLKSAFKVAKTLKLATFYDPEDPRNDLDVLFRRYKEDKEMVTLHIGIRYSWADEPGKTGHLFIVKNRLPPSLVCSVRPRVTEDEVMRSHSDADEASDSDWDPDAWGDLQNKAMGSYGCCDCCHTNNFNCGPKFPHGTFTGYLYLSPKWCSSLMRLGYHASKDAIDQVAGVYGPPTDVFDRGFQR